MVRARKNDDEEPPYDKHEERKANMNDLDLGDLYPNCLCGRRGMLCTSWTNANPGRRFWGCSNFRWYDPPIGERSKQIIPELLRRIQELVMRKGESNDFEGNHEDVSSAAAMGRNHQRLGWVVLQGDLLLVRSGQWCCLKIDNRYLNYGITLTIKSETATAIEFS
ncbi:hypothetical protein QYF36_014941 [Acer negundo]|nr:hypothetical protein QYF36_014941 [Acer negundo]